MAARTANAQHQDPEAATEVDGPQDDENDNIILHVQTRGLFIKHRNTYAHPDDDENDAPNVEVEGNVVEQHASRGTTRSLSTPNHLRQLLVQIDAEDDIHTRHKNIEDVVGVAGPAAALACILGHKHDGANN